MLTRSLYAQVIIALSVLLATLLAQLWLSRNNLMVLTENQQTITESYDHVGLVYELERDVIDLQRNLLIYKETASDTSVQRFYTIMERVEAELDFFQFQIEKDTQIEVDEKLISRMSGHLIDYQDNFSSVINGRSKREEIIQELDGMLEVLQEKSKVLYKGDENKLVKIQLHFSLLSQLFHDYLRSPDIEYTDLFKSEHAKLKKSILTDNKKTLIKDINKLKKRFIRLTHVTRGYIFLVNVVMAGSANEFLYLSEQIRKTVEVKKDQLLLSTKKSAETISFNNNIVAAISIFIAILIAYFLSRRILMPIKDITHVFSVLSRGDEIHSIPNTQREDEIGALAKAAEVFHDKNKQTHELLERSQDMIANQEVMNIQLENEKTKAEKAAQSKSMFLANMSHEIRTPMNGIVGLVDLVLKTELNSKQQNYLKRIAYSGQIMMNVINDILDFSKIEAGKMEIEDVEFEINAVIENLISAMIVRINEKEVDFRVIISEQVPKKLRGDPLRISQILLNLCSNSIKFTDLGYVEVTIDYQNGHMLFSISDTGIGMTEEQINTIFQSFTQADGSTSRKYGGTGLGLTIVKQLVDLMHGDIKLTSKVNEGTQIHLEILSQHPSVEKAISPIDLDDQTDEIYYLTDTGSDFGEKDLLNQYGLSVTSIIEADLTSICENNDKKSPVVFHANDIAFLEGNCEAIDAIIKANIAVGFILPANALKLKHYIYNRWHLPALSHPFSPSQSRAYLLDLYGIEKSEDDIPESQRQHAKFNGHVLLVEDNIINQLVAGDMLEGLGLTYDLAEDGKKAVDKITNQNTYDMVFMDVQMPIMDGYTATKKIRERGFHDLIICGLSANALSEDLDRAKEAGMSDYLTKPLQLHEMEEKLSQYLEQKPQKSQS